MTEKTVWEINPYGLQSGQAKEIVQTRPLCRSDYVCRPPAPEYSASLAEWPERARLICAAPDLLAACELALEWSRPVAEGTHPLGWALEVQPALEAAIAKATSPGELVGLPADPCSEPVEDEPPTEEPTPALKEWRISADDGEVLCLTAESIGLSAGDLCLWRGDELVARVAAGRWIAYWEDGAGNHFDA